jgi:hypothetical protein
MRVARLAAIPKSQTTPFATFQNSPLRQQNFVENPIGPFAISQSFGP